MSNPGPRMPLIEAHLPGCLRAQVRRLAWARLYGSTMRINQPARKAYRDIPEDQREAYRRGDLDLDDILPSEIADTTKRELVALLEGDEG